MGLCLAMDSYLDQLGCSCADVYVSPRFSWRSEAHLVTCIDYYYYATAGGAKIWVCAALLWSFITRLTIFAVEEVPHYHANCTIRHRPLCCVLCQCVLATELFSMGLN